MARPRVLLIDDSPLVLAATKAALEAEGYAVGIATTLDAFEAERRESPPNLIIVDVQMPEMFGDDLVGTLRGVYGEPAPIILLSSLDDEQLAERAREADAHGWVSKRAGMPAIVAKVREIFEATGRTRPGG